MTDRKGELHKSRANELLFFGVGGYDEIHVASAPVAEAEVFVTIDGRLLRRLHVMGAFSAMLQGEAITFFENWYENRDQNSAERYASLDCALG